MLGVILAVVRVYTSSLLRKGASVRENLVLFVEASFAASIPSDGYEILLGFPSVCIVLGLHQHSIFSYFPIFFLWDGSWYDC